MDVGMVGSLLTNVVSSVGIIVVNKRFVFDSAEFRFSTFLTIIHFLVTFFGCVFFAYIGMYKVKKLAIRDVIPLSLVFCGTVAFNNLSLLTNTVSVYQVSKIFCTPVIVIIEAYSYGKRESTATLLSLLPVCVGVVVTVYADTQLNFVGSLWALLAIGTGSVYTIWGKEKQRELDVEPMQLLLYQSITSAFLLIFVAAPLDGVAGIMQYTVTFTTVWTILLSCVFAFGVNFTFFFFVRKTSPLTMNVVGYLKTALVFGVGFLFYPEESSLQTLVGVTLTLIGLACYTRTKMSQAVAITAPSYDVNGKKDASEILLEAHTSGKHPANEK